MWDWLPGVIQMLVPLALSGAGRGGPVRTMTRVKWKPLVYRALGKPLPPGEFLANVVVCWDGSS